MVTLYMCSAHFIYLRKWRKILLYLSRRPVTTESFEPSIEITLRAIAFCRLDMQWILGLVEVILRLDRYWAGDTGG